eukprot:CAMPEP_0168269108 /NCGR_PEP_ID=MMETSP0141_2-20121125/14098_1 /TAXON_ID=44445 /ORGANISM="Pseudo-nitzschia australis, Strain 10249 10 AB" /LENGTH=143 /DNA_ID=CAMNT_0008209625 /DNA_START=247 /DNA_END=674 /DNA_ORIENTATION=+
MGINLTAPATADTDDTAMAATARLVTSRRFFSSVTRFVLGMSQGRIIVSRKGWGSSRRPLPAGINLIAPASADTDDTAMAATARLVTSRRFFSSVTRFVLGMSQGRIIVSRKGWGSSRRPLPAGINLIAPASADTDDTAMAAT